MWLPTTIGFFSIVCARKGDGKKDQPVDPKRMMIRARSKRHLENLQERFPALLSGVEIFERAGTDYPVRFFLSRAKTRRLVAGLFDDIDYDNFKTAVGVVDKTEYEYKSALMSVWVAFRTLQDRLVRADVVAKLRSMTALPFSRGRKGKLDPGATPMRHKAAIEPSQVQPDEAAVVVSVVVKGQDALPVATCVGVGPWGDGDDELLVADLIKWGMVGAIKDSAVGLRIDRLFWESVDERLLALPCFDLESDCLYEEISS